MKHKDLARNLRIIEGWISQIINDEEINFSIEKIIEISLKLGMIPKFTFDKFLGMEALDLMRKG